MPDLPPLPPSPALWKPPVQLRAITDTDSLRTAVYDNVLSAANSIPPVVGRTHTLQLRDVTYMDTDVVTPADKKRARMSGESLVRRMRGTWDLLDNTTQQPVASRTSIVAAVPKPLDDGTFIDNGTIYTMANQLRLRAGGYTRQKDNGELTTHINVVPGKGYSHHVQMDPESGVFHLVLGQANIPLLPLLRTLGMSDSQFQQGLAEELGDEKARQLVAANLMADRGTALGRLYEKLGKKGLHEEESKKKSIIEAIRKMELDPEVTQDTLGQPFDKLDAPVYMAAVRKLLRVSNGVAEPDERDAMAYQSVLGPEDIFAERLKGSRQALQNSLRKILWKSVNKGSLDHLPSGVLTGPLRSAILGSGLASPTEGINPLMLLDQRFRITRKGEGGITSNDAIPDESRAVHPSQFGFLDPVSTPESSAAGIDLRLSQQVYKGSDGRIYTPFKNIKTGQFELLSPQDVAKTTIALPKALQAGKSHAWGLKNGKIARLRRRDVQYSMPHMEKGFSVLSSMVPLKSAMKSQRAAMAQRMLTQALPLVSPEAPLVQSGVPDSDTDSYEQQFSNFLGAVKAQRGGQVVAVTGDEIRVRHEDESETTIPLVNHYPLPRKTLWHQTAAVKVGDMVQPGQLLAKSNYTDQSGTTALGLNARVAYIPDQGYNFEDAISVSESFAKRATSQHMYQYNQLKDDDVTLGRNKFIGIYPTKFSPKILKSIDDDGAVLPGTVVNEGDPLLLAVRNKPLNMNDLHSGRKGGFVDATTTWDHHTPGIVTDVLKTDKGINVLVKTEAQLKPGDKLSGRYGDKGVIARIIPDAEMPTDTEGRPFEMLVNPLGVITRANPSQIIETLLGKIAEKRGKPYVVKDFSDIEDLLQFTADEARKHNIETWGSIHDPKYGEIADVLSGNRFYMKLHHTADAKLQARDTGGYTMDDLPAKGGETGAKRISLLDTTALLSHGATAVVKDAHAVRGQSNTDYWRQVMSGYDPPPPEIPRAQQKFINSLKAAGINVVKDKQKMHLLAMTNKAVEELAEDRELQNADTVDWRDRLKPVKGGLFDETLTGGHAGKRWSFIRLHEPLPSPAFEEPICRVLGITHKDFEQILAEKKTLKGRTGAQAIYQALDKLDLTAEIARARADIASGKKTYRDAAVRRLQFLKSADRVNIHPREWMVDKVPVLPPLFRPVATMGNKNLPLVADPNYLYKEIFDANTAMKKLAGMTSDLGEERLLLYNAHKALTGLGDPTQPKNQERGVKGILKHVFGDSPKYGDLQFKLVGTTVDLVGRGTVIPDPEIGLDELGIPERQAWTIYRPFVVRRLVRSGLTPVQALREHEKQSDAAKQALAQEMTTRPVMMNRAPVLHRFGIMAYWPKIVKDDAIHTNVLLNTGLGMDYDGDAVQVHVPGSAEAVKDAVNKMLPSKNLFAPGNFKVHALPGKEYVGGLFTATALRDDKPVMRFLTKQDAINAYQRGEIHDGRRIQILQEED